jgi:hypothetical protein
MLHLLLTIALQPGAAGLSPQELWQAWPEERYIATAAPCLRYRELSESLAALAERYPGRLRLEEVGRSYQGRPIHLMTFGRGARKVLLWSQMHGDEPSATPALLDLADFLLDPDAGQAAEEILDGLTLLMVPMLNPDGAEIYERRNAQGIDINRDALNLATPEGRALKRIRDEHRPLLGFNLHDQNRRTAVGDTGVLATNAVLAVAGDPEGTLTPGRLRAKRACSAITETLAPFMPGGMARYDEEWSPRAFGDNLTAWGTPVVLIESGGLPPGRDSTELTRLNFVALLSVLHDLARNDLADYGPEIYDQLPRNNSNAWVDVAVRGGHLRQPGASVPYRADIAFDILRDDRAAAGCASGSVTVSRIAEIGDTRFLGAGRQIDATGGTLLAPFAAGVRRYSARRWLDAENLTRLARMGVGKLHWIVKPRRLEAARLHSRRLEGHGRPWIEVLAAPAPSPWLHLDGPPAIPRSGSLADILVALAGEKRRAEIERGSAEQLLDRVWANGLLRDPAPAMGRGSPASFLLVSPAPDGRLDPLQARLVSVWIDGVEVRSEQ